jgi:hypothetical protein
MSYFQNDFFYVPFSPSDAWPTVWRIQQNPHASSDVSSFSGQICDVYVAALMELPVFESWGPLSVLSFLKATNYTRN